jgi:hypothetical protein
MYLDPNSYSYEQNTGSLIVKQLAILIILTLGFCTQAFAQKELQDVVYLKNGSIIRGLIVETVPNKTVKIVTIDGSSFVFQMDDILRITKEPKVHPYGEDDESDQNRTYAGFLLVGLHEAVSNASGQFFSIHLVNAIHIDRSTLGAGIGLDLIAGASSVFLTPLWIDGRTFFGDGDAKTFLWGQFGYTLGSGGLGMYVGEGILYGAGFGIKYQSPGDIGFVLDAGYEVQNVVRGNYGAIQIRLGMAF